MAVLTKDQRFEEYANDQTAEGGSVTMCEVLFYYNLKMELREEYAIEYVESLMAQYLEVTGINPDSFVRGPGRRQTTEQKHYEELAGYLERLRKYAEKISICGEDRNSYSKTDRDATFIRKIINWKSTAKNQLRTNGLTSIITWEREKYL